MENNEIKFGKESTFILSKQEDDKVTVEGTLVVGDDGIYFETIIDTYFYDLESTCFATSEGLVLMLPDYEYGLLKEACKLVNILLF